ncbi:MAG: hypothetical protein KAI47_20825, partial [Deltaproteobacteria bacterium]|nr:hypothetical protein [Deltaproteobacteria bacterium]
MQESREARKLRNEFQEHFESVGEELQGANEDLNQAEDDLITLRKSAHVETDEALTGAEAQAARARDLDQRIADLTQQLLASGDGLGVEELETETTNVDIDSLPADLATLTADLHALRETRDAQRDEVKRLE